MGLTILYQVGYLHGDIRYIYYTDILYGFANRSPIGTRKSHINHLSIGPREKTTLKCLDSRLERSADVRRVHTPVTYISTAPHHIISPTSSQSTLSINTCDTRRIWWCRCGCCCCCCGRSSEWVIQFIQIVPYDGVRGGIDIACGWGNIGVCESVMHRFARSSRCQWTRATEPRTYKQTRNRSRIPHILPNEQPTYIY